MTPTEDPDLPDPADDSRSSLAEAYRRASPQASGFWIAAYLGAMVVGFPCTFLLAADDPRLPLGIAFFGVLIYGTVNFLLKDLRRSRRRVALAGVVGGVVGVVAVLATECKLAESVSPTLAAIVTAAAAALGAALAGFIHWAMDDAPDTSASRASGGFRVVLRRLPGRIAVLAVIAGLCLLVAAEDRRSRKASRKSHCGNKLKSICHSLSEYAYTGKGVYLPPAYLTDTDGEPILSWRVVAADYYDYDIDYRSHVDFDQRWDSPENAKFLNGRGYCMQCPELRDGDRHVTDYVAVVGPGTMWPGTEGRKWPQRKADDDVADVHHPILVVEWPESDIHWAEPRDVTVDEFLDWFRKPIRCRHTTHPDCILYVDTAAEVHELPLDSDPEEVRRLLMVDPDGDG